MSDFKAKMQQIRFWLGLCPRPCWGSLLPGPLAGFKGPFKGEGKEEGGGGKRGRKGEGRGKDRPAPRSKNKSRRL